MSPNAYIINGLRTPIGNLSGKLAAVRADDLLAHVLKQLLLINPGLDPKAIGDVIIGCANQAGEDNRNVARMSLLLAGYPLEVPGETVNRLCASGLSAAIAAARYLQTNDATIMVAGGVEQMTRGPWVMNKTATPYGRDMQLFDSSFGWRFINPVMKEMYGTDAMGETAENLVDRFQISRADQDQFALWSQQKAAKALNNGRLSKEITPITITQKKGDPLIIEQDEFIKPNTTLETLAKLKPSFRKDGTVTAGNASGLNDGAAAILLASEKGIENFQLTPIARIVSSAVTGVAPRTMGIGPVAAANNALAKAGLTWDQIDHLELNEAFAAQALACTRAWNLTDNDERINPNGGAIALGHPLGMSGTRILYSAALSLQTNQKKYAMVTMCIGVGMGYAVIIERV
jgi:acetyl-CoA acyltransferase